MQTVCPPPCSKLGGQTSCLLRICLQLHKIGMNHRAQDSVGNKGTVDIMDWICVSFPNTYVGILTVNIMVLGDEGI